MKALDAYRRQQKAAMPRVDLILVLYRKALDQMERASKFLREGQPEAARPHLTKAQLIVSGLGAGMAGHTDATTVNFQRLYEFVSYKLAGGTLEDIEAARIVLAPLHEAFEAIRDQAAALEAQGQIPPLEQDHQMRLTV